MPSRRRFVLMYDPAVAAHVRAIDPRHLSLVQKTVEEQLSYQPDRETRNRKPLRRPSTLGTAWELRFGPDNRFRVFYTVSRETWQVNILAIGEKDGSVLRLGGEEFTL